MVNIYFELNCTLSKFILQNIKSGLHSPDIGPENALSICYCNHLEQTNCSRTIQFFITYIYSKTNQPVWRSHHIEFDLLLIFVQAYCSTIRLKQKCVFCTQIPMFLHEKKYKLIMFIQPFLVVKLILKPLPAVFKFIKQH